MLAFLKSNAMQVAGAAQVVIGVILAFTHWTPAQVATVASLPSGIATFLVGLRLASNPTTPPPASPPPTPAPPPVAAG